MLVGGPGAYVALPLLSSPSLLPHLVPSTPDKVWLLRQKCRDLLLGQTLSPKAALASGSLAGVHQGGHQE